MKVLRILAVVGVFASLFAAVPAAQSQIPAPTPTPAAPICATAAHVCAGYGEADNTWHVGAGAGQYSDKSPDSVQGLADQSEIDPHNHSTTQKNSYGVQSRLSFRAIVVEDAEGDHVAFVKSDNYLAMDYLQRRAGQILAAEGSAISYDEIMHMASHNHYSPMYTTPSWGVWVFQDFMDIRAFEYQARQMAAAILEAEAALAPARMGATEVDHFLFKGQVQRRLVTPDGTPGGYPLDFGDFGLPVVRFDNLETGAPIATLINWGMHPEGLEADDLITAEFLAPLERFVERETGAPLVFGQGDVGSAESGPARPYHPDWPQGIFRQWDNAGHAQVERGAFLLASDVIRAYDEIDKGEGLVPFDSSFDVAAGNAFVPGPLSHPYPSVSNCRTHQTAEGNPGAPVAGLPDCARARDGDDRTQQIWESLKLHGLPLPEHYDAPAFTGVEENLRLHLQAFKMGEVILMSCACEAQVDLILNLESRTNETQNDMWLGYDWTKRLDCKQNEDTSWTCSRKANDTPDGASHPVSPGSTYGIPLNFTDEAMKRMKAQIYNDAEGWNDPENVVAANAEPADTTKIWGNFTHTELSADEGYALPIGVGHASDYNGYTVSYREYMSYDEYRKALTSYGPHTADYMNTVLMELARELNDPNGDHNYNMNEQETARAAADEARQQSVATALGAKSAAVYDAWQAALPDDVGPAESLAQPADIKRFDSTTFSWRGGSNAVDNPVVTVQRRDESGSWVDFADQSGEIQTKLDFPDGANGFAQTYAGNQEWKWTANFEAFNAFPAAIGSTPTGDYRFVVDGLIRQGGADKPYHLESEPFTVSRWDGVRVEDVRLEDDGSVSFTTDSTYPDLDEGAAFPYVRRHTRNEADRGEVRGEDIRTWCDTCSFRPWATKGEVEAAVVTVTRADGSEEEVPAQRTGDGRWVAAADLFEGDTARVAAGDVVDNYGERNGESSAAVNGTRPRTEPTPTPTETTEPTPTEVTRATTLEFTERSAETGQYTDTASFEVSLVDDTGAPVAGAPVDISLTGGPSQTVTTDDEGLASATFQLLGEPGSYAVTAGYAGETDRYLPSGSVDWIVVEKEDTVLTLSEVGPKNEKKLVAVLTDADDPSRGVAQRVIVFSVDGETLGSSTTNDDGEATISVPARYRNEKRTFTANFDGSGDTYFDSSSGTS